MSTEFCPCGFLRFDLGVWSAAWHRAHKTHHLATYPRAAADPVTVRNLDAAITRAERAPESSAYMRAMAALDDDLPPSSTPRRRKNDR